MIKHQESFLHIQSLEMPNFHSLTLILAREKHINHIQFN